MSKRQVTSIISDNLCAAVEEALARAVNSGLDAVFVIVPDRFTLQAERIILKKKSCVLNVRVVTFSMLFNILHEEIAWNCESKVLDKTSAVLFMWRAVLQVKDDLIWFGRSAGHYAFAEKMFNTVNQLSSSMVDFENLEANVKNGRDVAFPDDSSLSVTRKKMHDIALIHGAYKKLIEDYTDSSGMLGWLIENIRCSEIVKSAKIFVAGFPHLSIQRSAVVSELVKYSAGVVFGYQRGSEFEQFVGELVLNLGVDCKHIYIEGIAAENVKAPIVRAFDTVQAEAVWVANEICRLVKVDGVRFRDIVVVAGDDDNAVPVFCQVFGENGISVNIDVGEDLGKHPLTQYLIEFLLLASSGEQIHFINIIKSFYSGLSAEEEFELENKSLRIGLRGNEVTADLVRRLHRCKTAAEFVEVLVEIIGGVFEAGSDDIEERRNFSSFEDIIRRKLLELLETIDKIYGHQAISVSQFVNMFSTLASATKVSDIPTLADAVLVVAAAEYQPSSMPYVFVTGAIDGMFPVVQYDTDILTEQDIESVAVCIEPSASLQNARNRLHALGIMRSASEELYVTYSGTSPCELIEKAEPVCDDACIASRTFAALKVLRAIGDGTAFEDMEYYNGVLKSLNLGDLQYFNPFKGMARIDNSGELFFPAGYARVTQIDNFRKCPFHHFLEHGLKIRVRERNIIASHVMGSIIHKLAEVFTLKVIGLGGKQHLQNFDAAAEMNKTVASVLGMDLFQHFAADIKNAPVISNLKKEARILADELVRQIKCSEYFPVFAELSLQGEIEGVVVRGKADRIDVDGNNHAVIIDYKTGAVDKQSLQLPLYLGFLPEPYIGDEALYFALRPGSLKIHRPSGDLDVGGTACEIVSKIKGGVIRPEPLDKKACRYCVARYMCQGGQNEDED